MPVHLTSLPRRGRKVGKEEGLGGGGEVGELEMRTWEIGTVHPCRAFCNKFLRL